MCSPPPTHQCTHKNTVACFFTHIEFEFWLRLQLGLGVTLTNPDPKAMSGLQCGICIVAQCAMFKVCSLCSVQRVVYNVHYAHCA